jgi:bifunctional UDP-N-acetylglucosamine pyrophosphorylase/glucosamine-1-phosphate N-acetyltransferase
MGRPLLSWTIESLQKEGITEFIIIQSPTRAVEERINREKSPKARLRFLIQEQPLGMGDALRCAKPFLGGSFLVVHAHHIDAGRFVGPMLRQSEKRHAPLVLLGTPTERPHDYGILELAGDRVTGLVERPPRGRAPSNVRVVGIYLLPKQFFSYYRRLPDTQYDFEVALDRYAQEAEARVVLTERAPPSLKYPWDLFELCQQLMGRDLTDFRAKSAHIHPSAILEGPVHISKNVKIFEHAVVKGPCYLGEGCVIGTGSLVREYTNLEAGVLIGAHAEVTRSVFQSNCSTHSGYFGDSIFDEGVKVGAGTITANVRVDRGRIRATVKNQRVETGRERLGAIVGRETQLGINTMLMPGVLIGPRCQVGPGTIVSKNLDADTVYYARPAEIVRKRKP